MNKKRSGTRKTICFRQISVYNFHDENNEHLGKIEVSAGDDALKAFWHDLSSKMNFFASHADFLRKVAEIHEADW